jgi:hypothetical protein
LRTERRCETFLEYLEYLGRTEGWHLTQSGVHEILKNGNGLVLFDGLDEVFEISKREEITRQIVGLTAAYPEVRVIVTSRVIGYKRKIPSDAGFLHFTLQDLDEEQVELFVERWYRLALVNRDSEAEQLQDRIMTCFRESLSMRQLAANPMLLTIMAIIGKHQELPRERWKLYQHAACVLIQHWDVNKHLTSRLGGSDLLSEDDKEEMLRRLAHRMQAGKGGIAGNYIYRDLLQEEFTCYLRERCHQAGHRASQVATVVIDQLRERNFILSLYGAGLYGFVHRAFLEYFCASSFVNRFEKAKELDYNGLQSAFELHSKDESWHEVLRLVCGMLHERISMQIIDALCNMGEGKWPPSDDALEETGFDVPEEIGFAFQCLREVIGLQGRAGPARYMLKVSCRAFDLLMREGGWGDDEFIEDSVLPAAEALGPRWSDGRQLAEWLWQRHSAQNAADFAKPFGRFVGSVGSAEEKVRDVLMVYASHPSEKQRVLAPYALATGWAGNPKTVAVLQTLASTDPDDDVRAAAVEAIVDKFAVDKRFSASIVKRGG